MLTRQRLLLALLQEASQPVPRTPLVKLAFLLGAESAVGEDPTYYRFVPYKFGPFSFALYQEMGALERDGLVVFEDDAYAVAPARKREVLAMVRDLPLDTVLGVSKVVASYAGLGHTELLRSVYARYPWFTLNTERQDLCKEGRAERPVAAPAVYTAGYHAESIDGFLDRVLHAGIARIADVRANPVSRKFGFAGSRLRELAEKVGLNYSHFPRLGIPSSYRQELNSEADYESLFKVYGEEMLPAAASEMEDLARMCRSEPTALLCAEADPRFCHRSVLALQVGELANLEVVHL